jgi:hypothetical protein
LPHLKEVEALEAVAEVVAEAVVEEEDLEVFLEEEKVME